MKKLQPLTKRLLDIAVSAAALALFSPIFVLAALAVKLSSPGPVFFSHLRLGKGKQPFRMLKFRTMVKGACSLGPEFTTAEDWRVTSVGRILRKTKLDELPQLLNVLLGDMSLVGPRPQSLSLAKHYPEEDLAEILSVRPGITGPTQLRLRHEEELLARQDDPEAFYIDKLLPLKIASDKEYVHQWSVGADARIVTETVRAIANLSPHLESLELEFEQEAA